MSCLHTQDADGLWEATKTVLPLWNANRVWTVQEDAFPCHVLAVHHRESTS